MNLAATVGARIPHIGGGGEIPSVLLLHGTGVNGGTSFPDTSSYSGSNVITVTSSYLSTPQTQDIHGGAATGQGSSIHLDDQGAGLGSAVINVASGSWLEIASEQEWTLEFAIYLNGLPTTFNVNYVIAKMTNPQSNTGSGGSWRLNYSGTTNRFDFGQTESGARVSNWTFDASIPSPISVNFSAGRWMRVCLERHAGQLYYYLDGYVGHPVLNPSGVRGGIAITNVSDTSSDPIRISGQWFPGAGIFANGLKAAYISELRLTKGYARYQGVDYTPQTTPFPDI